MIFRPIVAGLLLAYSAAPHNHWWAGLFGLALLYRNLNKRTPLSRYLAGGFTFFVMFACTLAWTRQFSWFGWPLLSAFEAVFYAVACAFSPRRTALRPWAFASVLLIAEAIRVRIPFGGLPLGAFGAGQVDSPFHAIVPLAGELGLTFAAALCAAAFAEIFRVLNAHRISAVGGLLAIVVATQVGNRAETHEGRSIDVATIQAGGPQAVRIERQDPTAVFVDHLRTTATLDTSVDLILWPEDVVQVDTPMYSSPEFTTLQAVARSHRATLVAGVIELTDKRFRNTAVVFGSDGRVLDSYDKRQRVPFGEYVPGRSIVDKFVDLTQVPRDAIPGRGPGVLQAGEVRAAIGVSYEGLFSRHIADGVKRGGEVILIPTNAASYRSDTVARSELVAARLRAMETGRYAVQAAPTGISSFVDPNGRVIEKTHVGERQILQQKINLRTGSTPYTRHGDKPLVVLSALVMLLGCFLSAGRGHVASLLRGQRVSPS